MDFDDGVIDDVDISIGRLINGNWWWLGKTGQFNRNDEVVMADDDSLLMNQLTLALRGDEADDDDDQ